MASAELLAALESRLDRELSSRRAHHSRSVATLAEELCRLHGLDPLAGRLAGLAHDLAKELPREELEALAAAYAESGADKPDSALFHAKVLHGPAAARILAQDYGVDDAALLEAVAYHTIGSPRVGPLAMILYIADKLEPGRRDVSEELRSRILGLPLRAAYAATVAALVDWLRSVGAEVAPETRGLLEALSEEVRA